MKACSLILVSRGPEGRGCIWFVPLAAESLLPDELRSLADRARASVPPRPPLPWFNDGEVIEPRQVAQHAAGGGDGTVEVVADEPRPVAPPTVTVRLEPQPRRSLRKEREHRQLVALAKLLQETQRLQRQMQEARRLQLLIVLVAAARRAGMVG